MTQTSFEVELRGQGMKDVVLKMRSIFSMKRRKNLTASQSLFIIYLRTLRFVLQFGYVKIVFMYLFRRVGSSPVHRTTHGDY